MLAPPNCYKRKCVHLLGVYQPTPGDESTEVPHCLAFPEGIPQEIAYGDNKHLKKVDGQTGKFVYEKGS
jgi:hypothetical protein